MDRIRSAFGAQLGPDESTPILSATTESTKAALDANASPPTFVSVKPSLLSLAICA